MTYTQVIRTLDPYRAEVLSEFARRGGDRDRWAKRDLAHMADAITHVEDRLDLEYRDHRGPKKQARETLIRLQETRQALEVMVWP